jgi:glycosyltransferase involved in cell wall biosynthesis
MKVSVVMSCYNHESFVSRAIESVIEQEFQDWEFVIRDDASQDETARIVSAYDDERIRFLGSDLHLGGAASLNQCIAQARGEYIAVINSDDVFLPPRLSIQLPILEENPTIGAVFAVPQIIDEQSQIIADGAHPYFSIFHQPNRNRFAWLNFFFARELPLSSKRPNTQRLLSAPRALRSSDAAVARS